MARRTVFTPVLDSEAGVKEQLLDFEWFPGMAKTQKQKSIRSLHEAAKEAEVDPVLEISTKSENELGIKLSAFNLIITTKKQGRSFSVETAFQSSKVFEQGGPYTDLRSKSSRDAKKDIRLRESGNLVTFTFFDKSFPINPKTFFYDWLYINALVQHDELTDGLLCYMGFTDIEFNPKKSINCQAYSAALYSSLFHTGQLFYALESPEAFKEVLSAEYRKRDTELQIQSVLI